MTDRNCKCCGSCEETRPYGRNGSFICFDCAMQPENKEEVEKNFLHLIQSLNSPIVIIGEDGPRHASYEEAVAVTDIIEGLDIDE